MILGLVSVPPEPLPACDPELDPSLNPETYWRYGRLILLLPQQAFDPSQCPTGSQQLNLKSEDDFRIYEHFLRSGYQGECIFGPYHTYLPFTKTSRFLDIWLPLILKEDITPQSCEFKASCEKYMTLLPDGIDFKIPETFMGDEIVWYEIEYQANSPRECWKFRKPSYPNVNGADLRIVARECQNSHWILCEYQCQPGKIRWFHIDLLAPDFLSRVC